MATSETTGMYGEFFGFRQRPFSAIPLAEHYFPAATIENARATLTRCIERDEGIGVVLGPPGAGKTLLCRALAEQFRQRLRAVVLSGGRLGSRRALFQAILYELGRPYRGLDEGEARLALIDFLTTHDDGAAGMLLMLDEAQLLPIRLLDEVRVLTNICRDRHPQVRLVLAAGPVLEERLTSPRLESFNQRIVARCYLEPFNRAETAHYIAARITAAGGDAGVLFPQEACLAVHRATDGIPRLVNQVCDHALLLAWAAGKRTVDAALVEEAWADLQQLPPPWQGSTPGQTCGVVEFGQLQDEEPTGVGLPSATASPADAEPGQAKDAAADLSAELALLGEPDSENTPDMAREAEKRMNHIAHMLAEVEATEVSQPMPGPEVTLVFDDPMEMFAEQFAEEEIVAERCSPAAGANPVAISPAVQAMKEPSVVPTARESVVVPLTTEPVDVPTRGPTPAAAGQPYSSAPVAVPAPLSAPFPPPVFTPVASTPAVPTTAAPTPAVSPVAAISEKEASPSAAASWPVEGNAQRRNYRQLFTALRRKTAIG